MGQRGGGQARSGVGGFGGGRRSRGSGGAVRLRLAGGPKEVRSYWVLSARPLYSAVLLLPLVVAYEVGSVVYLAPRTEGGGVAGSAGEPLRAKRLLGEFFESFGVVGLMLPAIALMTVLVLWHVLAGHRWKVRWKVLMGMAVESAAWTLPLVVLGGMVRRAMVWHGGGSGGVAAAIAQAADPQAELARLPWQVRGTISIGAGLYEEMLFRLIGLAALHAVFCDVLKVKEKWGTALSLGLTAAAFALHHDLRMSGGNTDWVGTTFLFMAGVYFGAIYLTRGFGIVAATHALYDVFVLVVAEELRR